MKVITSADFESEVLKSDKPVLIDFFATWCQPCKQIAPLLEQLAIEKADKVKIVKLDVDTAQDVAAKYSVRSIPTLIIFRGGDVIGVKAGAAPKSEISKWIDNVLAFPAGSKIDLAPNATNKLTDAQKKTLSDAFNAAINASPDADKPTKLLTQDGTETTLREQFKKDLNSGNLYKSLEEMITLTGTPANVLVDSIVAGLKKDGIRLPKA